MRLYGHELSLEQLNGYVSSLQSLGGILPFEFTEGPARGMRGLQVANGAGLRYIILPDRALDLGQAFFQHFPLAWRSSRGETHPAYGDTSPLGMLTDLGGGLMFTCGLDNIGSPCELDGKSYPLHGSLHRQPATQVAWGEEPAGDDIELVVRGVIQQSEIFGFHFRLDREIRTPFSQNQIRLTDRITNLGGEPAPLLILYHWNFGFPLLSPASRIEADILSTQPRDAAATQGLPDCLRFEVPHPGPEQVFFHTLRPDAAGHCHARLIDPGLNPPHGLGIELSFPQSQLPYFTQWKLLRHGAYVSGLEPSNVPLIGRAECHRLGSLPLLQPRETRTFDLTLQVIA